MILRLETRFDHFLIELLDHLVHVGVLVKVLWKDALFGELMDLRVEFWNHLFEFLLESFVFGFLLGLYIGNDIRQLLDHHFGLSMVLLFFLLELLHTQVI